MTGDQGDRGGAWSPWAPRSGEAATPPVRHRPSALTRPVGIGSTPPHAAHTSADPTALGAPPVVPVPEGSTTGGAGRPWRAPVADQDRPPGAPSTPPTSRPAPLIDKPVPGAAPRRDRSHTLTAFVSFLVGAIVVGAAFGVYALGERRADDGDAAVGAGDPVTALDIRTILEKAQPSVVTIQTGHQDSIFGGTGSGVIISDDGLILTNAHVIAGAGGVIQVRFNDGSTGSASLVGANTGQDIALIRADRSGLTPATLGSSADLRVGDDVVAIGNALNLGGDPSVTSGIVSAKDRSITDGQVSLDNLIQTDAAINPGNSGGPLVDARGRVVGINTAIIEGAQNVGFSIAIDPVKALIPELEAGGGDITPDTALLGIRSVTVDADLDVTMRDRYGVVADAGALIAAVDPESPAEDAGLEVGDVVVEFDGSPILSNEQLTEAVRSRSPGDTVNVTVERLGRRRSFDVTLGSN